MINCGFIAAMVTCCNWDARWAYAGPLADGRRDERIERRRQSERRGRDVCFSLKIRIALSMLNRAPADCSGPASIGRHRGGARSTSGSNCATTR